VRVNQLRGKFVIHISKSCTQRTEDIRQAGGESNWMFSETLILRKHEHIDNNQLQNNNTQ